MINKILIPIDGSEHSKHALNFAVDLAEKYAAEIKLISVSQPIINFTPMYPTEPMISPINTTMFLKEIEEKHLKLVKEAQNKIKKANPKLRVTTQVLNGRPADVIVEVASEENFDLIVMGSRGIGGIKEFFLGSVSDRVADGAPCPVLIVK